MARLHTLPTGVTQQVELIIIKKQWETEQKESHDTNRKHMEKQQQQRQVRLSLPFKGATLHLQRNKYKTQEGGRGWPERSPRREKPGEKLENEEWRA